MTTATALNDISAPSSAMHWQEPASFCTQEIPELPAAADAMVHLIHPNALAAHEMARSWAAPGVRTTIHADKAGFAAFAPSPLPACLIIHLGSASGDNPELEFGNSLSDVPVIITADHADARAAVLAIKAGAIDFFEAPLVAGELREAVKAAIDADQIRREATSHRKALLARFATLTPREREVMALVTRGLLNKQVAGDLGLSEITVKVHRGSAMRKMAARTLADLVRMADAIARPEPGPGAWNCLNGLRRPRSN